MLQTKLAEIQLGARKWNERIRAKKEQYQALTVEYNLMQSMALFNRLAHIYASPSLQSRVESKIKNGVNLDKVLPKSFYQNPGALKSSQFGFFNSLHGKSTAPHQSTSSDSNPIRGVRRREAKKFLEESTIELLAHLHVLCCDQQKLLPKISMDMFSVGLNLWGALPVKWAEHASHLSTALDTKDTFTAKSSGSATASAAKAVIGGIAIGTSGVLSYTAGWAAVGFVSTELLIKLRDHAITDHEATFICNLLVWVPIAQMTIIATHDDHTWSSGDMMATRGVAV